MKTQKQIIGAWGEQEAVEFLIEKGYDILERNFRTRAGELDIIAWHDKPFFGKTLCFIEVKTRGFSNGSAERATGFMKLSNLFMAARAFCLFKKINMDSTPIQFEQVSVYGTGGNVKSIRHYVIPVD